VTTSLLRHDAFVYDSDDLFVERMAPFVRDAFASGEDAVAITTRTNCALLREELGDESERLTLVDRDEWYVTPAHVIAGFDKTLSERLAAGAPAVRVIGEVQFGATPREWTEWTAYESIVNRAFADRPAWVVCPYDARVLPDPIVDAAFRTHPQVLRDGWWHESPHYDDPDHLVRALTPVPEPLDQLHSVLVARDPRAFRQRLRSEMARAGVPEGKAARMLVAAGEVLANALRHGGGVPRVRVGWVGGSFVVEISDDGGGLDDPLAGYIPPTADQAAGAGLWVARQMTSRLELISGDDGLSVRLWV
jgi:anti-sigma regulatory factor (Ser/Thr protein kinase)